MADIPPWQRSPGPQLRAETLFIQKILPRGRFYKEAGCKQSTSPTLWFLSLVNPTTQPYARLPDEHRTRALPCCTACRQCTAFQGKTGGIWAGYELWVFINIKNSLCFPCFHTPPLPRTRLPHIFLQAQEGRAGAMSP